MLRVSAAGVALLSVCAIARADDAPPHSAQLDAMIVKAAKRHGVPETLVRRIVMRESRYNPEARNHRYWGLMQISYPTARSMGFKGSPQELLNPLVNLTYAVPYLANAFIIAGKREDAAVRLYASGYYDTARRKGLIGMLRTADSTPLSATQQDDLMVASAQPVPDYGIFGALFTPGQQPQAQPQMVAAAEVQATTAAPQAPAPAAPAPSVSAATASTQMPALAPAPKAVETAARDKASGDTDMVPGRKGMLEPPKKWQRDGGMTVMARGEQAVEKIAAFAQGADAETRRKVARGRAHKNTAFALLEAPPANAQAYAATAEPQDARFAQTASQAAIAQATVAQSALATDPAAAQFAAGGRDVGPRPDTVAADDVKPAKRSHTRVARKSRAQDEGSSEVAKADRTSPDDEAPARSKKGHARHAAKKTQTAAVLRTEDAPAQATPQ